jgi:hypothetical protein
MLDLLGALLPMMMARRGSAHHQSRRTLEGLVREGLDLGLGGVVDAAVQIQWAWAGVALRTVDAAWSKPPLGCAETIRSDAGRYAGRRRDDSDVQRSTKVTGFWR